MLFLRSSILSKPWSPLCGAVDIDHSFNLHPFPSFSLQNLTPPPSTCFRYSDRIPKSLPCFAVSKKSDSIPDPEPSSNRKPKSKPKPKKDENPIPTTIPKKPRRGRRSEAAAVEDYIRDSLEKTFSSIREQNSGSFENKEKIMKERVDDDDDDKVGNESSEDEDEDEDEDDENENEGGKKVVVEEENPNWPLDTEVGWGIRASEYFEQHPIKNVVGEDGVEIDWEGETDDNWVKEINVLEWESFAFHPSPLIVFVFERYNRATDNWKVLKELEKALQVYWNAKDRLPPRSVKIDINIERDLAYALKVKDCPQILFLRGNRILYREKEIRTADELVHMIAHFYYNAKRPSWIDIAALSPPY